MTFSITWRNTNQLVGFTSVSGDGGHGGSHQKSRCSSAGAERIWRSVWQRQLRSHDDLDAGLVTWKWRSGNVSADQMWREESVQCLAGQEGKHSLSPCRALQSQSRSVLKPSRVKTGMLGSRTRSREWGKHTHQMKMDQGYKNWRRKTPHSDVLTNVSPSECFFPDEDACMSLVKTSECYFCIWDLPFGVGACYFWIWGPVFFWWVCYPGSLPRPKYREHWKALWEKPPSFLWDWVWKLLFSWNEMSSSFHGVFEVVWIGIWIMFNVRKTHVFMRHIIMWLGSYCLKINYVLSDGHFHCFSHF